MQNIVLSIREAINSAKSLNLSTETWVASREEVLKKEIKKIFGQDDEIIFRQALHIMKAELKAQKEKLDKTGIQFNIETPLTFTEAGLGIQSFNIKASKSDSETNANVTREAVYDNLAFFAKNKPFYRELERLEFKINNELNNCMFPIMCRVLNRLFYAILGMAIKPNKYIAFDSDNLSFNIPIQTIRGLFYFKSHSAKNHVKKKIYEFCELLTQENIYNFKDSRFIEFPDGASRINVSKYYKAFDIAIYDEKEDILKVKFNKEFFEFASDETRYTLVNFGEFLSYTTKYEQRLYLIFRQFRDSGECFAFADNYKRLARLLQMFKKDKVTLMSPSQIVSILTKTAHVLGGNYNYPMGYMCLFPSLKVKLRIAGKRLYGVNFFFFAKKEKVSRKKIEAYKERVINSKSKKDKPQAMDSFQSQKTKEANEIYEKGIDDTEPKTDEAKFLKQAYNQETRTCYDLYLKYQEFKFYDTKSYANRIKCVKKDFEKGLFLIVFENIETRHSRVNYFPTINHINKYLGKLHWV